MKVRAKMRCVMNSPQPTGQSNDICHWIRLEAVYNDGDKENESWSKYTPSGQVVMTVTNPSAVDAFELGEFYYVDFIKADAPEAQSQP